MQRKTKDKPLGGPKQVKNNQGRRQSIHPSKRDEAEKALDSAERNELEDQLVGERHC